MGRAATRLPYRVKEVAGILSVSEEFVRKEIREGRLKARHKRGGTRTWWITQSDLDEWMAGGMLDGYPRKEGS